MLTLLKRNGVVLVPLDDIFLHRVHDVYFLIVSWMLRNFATLCHSVLSLRRIKRNRLKNRRVGNGLENGDSEEIPWGRSIALRFWWTNSVAIPRLELWCRWGLKETWGLLVQHNAYAPLNLLKVSEAEAYVVSWERTDRVQLFVWFWRLHVFSFLL